MINDILADDQPQAPVEFRYQIIRFRIEDGREIPRLLGIRTTLDEAKARAEHFAMLLDPTHRWDQISDVFWALRTMGGDTGLRVRRIKKPTEWEG